MTRSSLRHAMSAVASFKAFRVAGQHPPDVAAAAFVLRAFSVVRAQVSVLRFQLARVAGPSTPTSPKTTTWTPCAPTSNSRCRWSGAAPCIRCLSAGARRACCPPPGLDRLLSDIRALLPLDADAEITMEANPGTFEAARFAQFRASGVNRLSIGIQSFNATASPGAGPHPRCEREARACHRHRRRPASTT